MSEVIIGIIAELTIIVTCIFGIYIVFTQGILPIYNHSNSKQETKVESSNDFIQGCIKDSVIIENGKVIIKCK